MSTEDIFMIVSNILNKNHQEDVNGLYNLSQTCKQMNNLVQQNSDYDSLKKIARFPRLYKGVTYHVSRAINACTNEDNIIDIESATKIVFEDTSCIVPYITKKDLDDINTTLSVLFEDWNDTSIPRKERDLFPIEGKMLYDFIKRVDSNYKITLVLSFMVSNKNEYCIIEEDFHNWVSML